MVFVINESGLDYLVAVFGAHTRDFARARSRSLAGISVRAAPRPRHTSLLLFRVVHQARTAGAVVPGQVVLIHELPQKTKSEYGPRHDGDCESNTAGDDRRRRTRCILQLQSPGLHAERPPLARPEANKEQIRCDE